MFKNILSLLIVLFVLISKVYANPLDQKMEKQGVYEYVIQNSESDFEQVSNLLTQKIDSSAFKLLAIHDVGVPKSCNFRSKLFIIYEPEFLNQIIQANRTTAPFAAVDRINLFEDENGLHVAIINTSNIIRTVLMDDESYNDLAITHKAALRQIIHAAGIGSESHKQFGQFRKKGHIGKTMGVMAGGPFDEKIKTVAELPEGDFTDVVNKLETGLKENNKEWGVNAVYKLSLEETNIVVFGSTSSKIESKSSDIVKAGSDKNRKNLKFPGIAHSGGYPIEIVVTEEEGIIKVRLVNIMYRMKMFFEDAGKWAFMKNMGMPGSIQDELEKQIKVSLSLK